jgi:hypothetical protein
MVSLEARAEENRKRLTALGLMANGKEVSATYLDLLKSGCLDEANKMVQEGYDWIKALTTSAKDDLLNIKIMNIGWRCREFCHIFSPFWRVSHIFSVVVCCSVVSVFIFSIKMVFGTFKAL